MKLSVTGMACAVGVLWGLSILVTGVANLLWPPYGQELLQLAASIYPGYHATASFGQVLVGTLYGVVDALVAGAVLALLYNAFAARGGASESA
jgi:hypothetical protein